MTGRQVVLLTLIALLAIAAPAAATVNVDGTGEPRFTNTTTNTQWINYQGSSSYESYQLEYEYYDNNVLVKTITQPVGVNASGTGWADWAGIVNALQEGHSYSICVFGRYTISGIPARETSSCVNGANQDKRSSTTIDLTKPSATVAIDNGAAYSRTGQLDYVINYSDNLAPPFPANFMCRDIGTAPNDACVGKTLSLDTSCSVPNEDKKLTFFNCSEDLSTSAPDGPVTVCVRSADSAVPDKHYSSNQTGSASQANLSELACDSITIDKTAPAVSAGSAAGVTAGDLVLFQGQASDATSGVSGNYAWDFGDGAKGTGIAPSHTYAQAGVYEAKLTTTDNAGNTATAKRTITVAARPEPASAGGGSGTTDTPQTPSAPAGAPAPSPAAASKLAVSAPKRVKVAPRLKALALALSADGPGSATFALVRSGKVHAQGAVALTKAGIRSYRLKLAKKLAAGAYQLKVLWTPSGATAAKAMSLKLTVVAAKKK